MNRLRTILLALLAFLGLTVTDLKYAVRSAVFALLGVLIPGLLSWLNELTRWAPGQAFPDTRALGVLAISAVAAGFTALVTLIWRAIENKLGKAVLRPNPPKV